MAAVIKKIPNYSDIKGVVLIIHQGQHLADVVLSVIDFAINDIFHFRQNSRWPFQLKFKVAAKI